MNDPQFQLAIASGIKTQECTDKEFDALAARQMLGEIRLLTLWTPGKKDRWTWKVQYEVLK